MKASLLVSTITALLAGCASGGGSGGGTPAPASDPALQPLRPGYQPSPCGTLYGYPVPCVSRFPGNPQPTAQVSVPTFDGWATLPRDRLVGTEGNFIAKVPYDAGADGGVLSMQPAVVGGGRYGELEYGLDGAALYFASGVSRNRDRRELSTLAAVGQGWMDVARRAPLEGDVQSPFTSVPATEIELAANPYRLGWNYQSFGAWDATFGSTRYFGGTSYGSATPASAVPASGTATFSGKLAGFYLPPAGEGALATADLRVSADFSSRVLSFVSSRTALTRDLVGAVAAPNLDLRGTLTYAPGTNTFSGTLSNSANTMSGSSKGQFYGPAAQELGGAFAVKAGAGRETFSGAYGAKR